MKVTRRFKLFYKNDADFIEYWKVIRDKGLLRYILSQTLAMVITMALMSIIFIKNHKPLWGYQDGAALLAALLYGLFIGVICAPISWAHSNNRYNELQNK